MTEQLYDAAADVKSDIPMGQLLLYLKLKTYNL